MKINIYGMGYVGCVSAACLANEGHIVTGIDIDETKVSIINKGRSPIIEKGLPEMIKKGVQSNRFKATVNNAPPADVSIVCVGTPSNANGSLNLQHIFRVCEQIGRYIRKTRSYHVVNIRSTILPGTLETLLLPLLTKESKKKAGRDFGICMNPEFMRESSSIHDFYNPPFTIIGEYDKKSGIVVSKLYKNINAPLIKTNIKVAEMIKYACNAFHALKVSFGNEIGNVCKELNIDSHKVMEIFCKDKKLNLSSYYLKPGFAFGGSCLPKDLRALIYKAKELDLELPVMQNILRTNSQQIDIAFEMIRKCEKRNVGVIGLSFKAGTDDLRESPMVELVERLIGKGYNVRIFDKDVSLARIHGANKAYINRVIPHISSLLKKDLKEVTNYSNVLVVGNKCKEFIEYSKNNKHKRNHIIDLVNIKSDGFLHGATYEGICW